MRQLNRHARARTAGNERRAKVVEVQERAQGGWPRALHHPQDCPVLGGRRGKKEHTAGSHDVFNALALIRARMSGTRYGTNLSLSSDTVSQFGDIF